MMCKRCMTVMKTGTRYEKNKGQDRPSYKKYFECNNCHNRFYTNKPNFKEYLKNTSEKI